MQRGSGLPREVPRDVRATALAVILVTELIVLMLVLVPVMGAAGSPTPGAATQVTILGWNVTAQRSAILVILSLVGGALGGALHGVASLTQHVAADDFDRHWTLWYLANPFVGAAVATVFLFVLQAGIGGQPAAATQDGSYGIVAVATLSGLFSRHALAKLKEIFDVAVGGRSTTDTNTNTGADAGTGTEARTGAPPQGDLPGVTSPAELPGVACQGELAGPPSPAELPGVTSPAELPGVPKILALSPSAVPVASEDPPLTITGTGFAPDSVVDVAGLRVPAGVGPEEISLRVPAELVAREGELAVRVRSRGVWSNPAELEVRA